METDASKLPGNNCIPLIAGSRGSIVYLTDIRTNEILYVSEYARNIIMSRSKDGSISGLPAKEIAQSGCMDLFHGKTIPSAHCMKCRYYASLVSHGFEYFEPYVTKYRHIRTRPLVKAKKRVTGLPCTVKETAIQSRTERELKKANRMFKISNECNGALLQIRDEIDLLNEICRIIVDLGDYRLAWAGYVDSYEARKISVAAHAGAGSAYIEIVADSQEGSEKDKSPFWKAIESEQPFVIRDIRSIRGAGLWQSEAVKRGINSLLIMPLHVDETLFGVLNIYASVADAFDPEEVGFFKKLAENLSSHLSHMRSHAAQATARAADLHAGHLCSLTELAAGVAHEINNPINGIINYAQILKNTSKPDTKELDIASRIIRESERVAVIVRSLLSFANERYAEKVPANVHDLISSAMALTETQLKNDGITVNLDIPRLLPDVYAQPQNLEQVFLSIISNSRYALNQKYDGTHEKKLIEIGVTVRTFRSRHFLEITFYDNGIGIPANIINKVVNPFFSTKPSNRATGLGLSISHGIISGHGGKLLIDSIEGEFTKVSIELPVLDKSEMKMN